MAHAPVVSDDDEPTQSETAPKAPAIAVPVVAAPEEPVTSTPINYTRMKVGVGFMIAAALVALAPAVKAVVTSLAAPTEVAAEPAPAPAADDAKASSVSALKARAKAVKQHK
ncbi:MAG: hypothetical protein IPJ65_36910 [Archangiaceae bacterium]|nr:hypothetical protein [Archangiaceae bacterium]